MKIEEKSTVKVLRLTEVERLDPITVYLEDIEPKRGKITIECFGTSWSSFFGSMGDGKTIAKFCTSVSTDYLAGKLFNGIDEVDDMELFAEMAQREIIKKRRKKDLNADEARELWHYIEHRFPESTRDGFYSSEIEQVFGDEWWYRVTKKPSNEFAYCIRVTTAVQEGLRQWLETQKAS